MEYNYTREFNQPIKFYTFPNGTAIPYAKNGVRLDYLVLTGVLIVVGFVIFLISLYTKINFVQSVYKNGWLIILVGIGVLVWALFSLKWDNKNFIDYCIGRAGYKARKATKYEHGHIVPQINKIHYRPIKRGRPCKK
ncbi:MULTISPECIES: TcpE family conjugal transfer membrane protein [Carnobacterium]|jgi:hypothetical protein|uniref:TcpE family conjugal transfer membrane protein n=1 Tax=Carnobacterium TaxID=2747 RepID=UPI000E75F541|nr:MULTISPECIES: TcpE family conjugal transfer membrane protein [Carnobacterium]AOA04162.1 hypothetical protein BFC23_15960 [Carnobacterium maltaromaticum]MBQ6485267.1 conjugal transfer protein [Carnobacterium sp.]TFJ73098.1 conjugal transfer protein [Carnobacterium maltaromaticum]TFJ77961.1 conjugal transfer protein [Carnobacterium maltaromaticum]